MGACGHRTIVVPLLGGGEADRALVTACRLAADRARVFLVAPLAVEQELPLDAHFDAAEPRLHDSLARERALVESFGLAGWTKIVRTRPDGDVGHAVGALAAKEHASLVVVAADTMPLTSDVRSILRHAPCRTLLLHAAQAAPAERAA